MNTRGTEGRITLKEIAAIAGVSHATASKVLNGREGIADATRERVMAVMNEHGYRPTVARGEPAPPAHVSAVFAGIDTQYAASLLEGLALAASAAGIELRVSLEPSLGEIEGDAEVQAWLDGHARAAGVVTITSAMTPKLLAAAHARGLPIVAIDPINTSGPHLVSVSSTDWAGGRSATQHVLSLGHRRIGWLGGNVGSAPNIERFHGFRAAIEQAGLPETPELYLSGEYTFDSGVTLGGQLLDSAEPPTAIVCANDAIAFGLMKAAQRRGLTLPDDLSVTGYDDVPHTEWNTPTLTSVRHPLQGIGRVAVDTLLSLARGVETPAQGLLLATSLIERESTAPPRGRA